MFPFYEDRKHFAPLFHHFMIFAFECLMLPDGRSAERDSCSFEIGWCFAILPL